MKMTQQRLKELLNYDETTGVFVRLQTGPSVRAGDIAGSGNGRGYTRIYVDGKRWNAHHLAWLYVHGTWPTGEIDHINGEPSDNRICNLREATRSQNCANKTTVNSTGYRGVYFRRRDNTYGAEITSKRVRIHLGTFKDAEEAHRAYCEAARLFHGAFARMA